MAFEDWDKRPNGDLAIGPLLEWEVLPIPLAAIVRLVTARSPDQLKTGEVAALQLGMTASQAREFAQALLRMADRIDRQPLGSPQ